MRRSPLTFFLLTFAATWLCWFGADALGNENPTTGTPLVVHALVLLGTIAPSLVALALTARLEGRAAVRRLLGRVVRADVGLRWYIFAVGFMPAVKLLAAVSHRVLLGVWPRFGDEAWWVMLGTILVSMWVQAGEEIGWRGYALPALSERVGLAIASLILGVAWASWHLPLFVMLNGDTFGQSFPLYLTQVTALSVTAAWLYWRTCGSLLVVMLWHAAVNNTKDIVPSAVPGATDPFAFSTLPAAWLTALFLWIAAAYFLVRMRSVRGDLNAAKGTTGRRRCSNAPRGLILLAVFVSVPTAAFAQCPQTRADRPLFVAGGGDGVPLGGAGSVGLLLPIWDLEYGDPGCSVPAYLGLQVDAAVGMGGHRFGVGLARRVKADGRPSLFGQDVVVSFARTRASPRGADPHSNYLAVEAGLTVLAVRVGAGAARRLTSGGTKTTIFVWSVGAQIGW